MQVAPAFGAAALTGVARDMSKTPPIASAPHLRMVNYEDSAVRVLGFSSQKSSPARLTAGLLNVRAIGGSRTHNLRFRHNCALSVELQPHAGEK